MSLTTMDQASKDIALINRVVAAVQQEGQNNPVVSDTVFAQVTRQSPSVGQQLVWPVAIDYEDEYEFAVNNDNPNPGGDPGVITDGNISAAVVAHWPPDPA